ncbi:PAS domain S-box protein [bacterium]|nr:PAS domain S-box protein [bacterium]
MAPTFDGVMLHDGEVMLEVNEVLAQMFGYAPSELVGQHLRVLLERSWHEEVRPRIVAHDHGPYEAIALHRDGSEKAVQIIASEVGIEGRRYRVAAFRDVTEQRTIEEQLRTTNNALMAEQSRLQRKNAALAELLERLQAERDDLAAEIHANLDRLVFPIIHQLISRLEGPDRRLLQQLSATLKEITAPYIYRLESAYSSLSPREVEVCSYIKAGLSCKDIASTLNVSINTVLKQRQRIRQKLGISNEPINLTTYLKTI